MPGRTVARFVTALALLAASASWAGWLFLRTAADPARSDRIAHAILDDPRARQQVAADISRAIATAANKARGRATAAPLLNGDDPTLQAAVESALADPRVTSNLIDAVSAEHARALGVTPAHPATIDTALLLGAVRAHLAPVEPAVARAIPSMGASQIRLPAAKIPFARQARDFAERWVGLGTVVAVGGLLLAFLIGDRAWVLRRAGSWAIGAGLCWVVVPIVIAWAGDRWAASQAAVIRAVLKGATGTVTGTAVALIVAGLAAVVVSVVAPHLLGAIGGAAGSVRRMRPSAGPTRPLTAAPPPSARPRTDTWAPGPAEVASPVAVYDRQGNMDGRPVRRPGVSRVAMGAEPVASAADWGGADPTVGMGPTGLAGTTGSGGEPALPDTHRRVDPDTDPAAGGRA